MSISRLQNTETSEFRDVEVGSAEHRSLMEEVGQSGLPKWADAKPLEETDEIWTLSDYARDHLPTAILLHMQKVPVDRNPHLVLTRGEIEAGLTPQSKLADLLDQYGHMMPAPTSRQEGDPAPDEAAIAKQAAAQAAATRAAAGGSRAPAARGKEAASSASDSKADGSDEGDE